MGSGRNNLIRLADDFTTYKQELKKEREENRRLAKIEKLERQANKEAKILWELKKEEVEKSLEGIFELYFENYPYNEANIYLRSRSGFNKVAKAVQNRCKVEKVEEKTYFNTLNIISKMYKYEAKPQMQEKGEKIKKAIKLIEKILKIVLIAPFIFIFIFLQLLPHPKNKK